MKNAFWCLAVKAPQWSSFNVTENVSELTIFAVQHTSKLQRPSDTQETLGFSNYLRKPNQRGVLKRYCVLLCPGIHETRNQSPNTLNTPDTLTLVRENKTSGKGNKVLNDILSKLTILLFVRRTKHRNTSKTQGADMSVVGANQRVSDGSDWLVHVVSTHSWCIHESS